MPAIVWIRARETQNNEFLAQQQHVENKVAYEESGRLHFIRDSPRIQTHAQEVLIPLSFGNLLNVGPLVEALWNMPSRGITIVYYVITGLAIKSSQLLR